MIMTSCLIPYSLSYILINNIKYSKLTVGVCEI